MGWRQRVRTRPPLPLSQKQNNKKTLTSLPEQGEEPQVWKKDKRIHHGGEKHTALIYDPTVMKTKKTEKAKSDLVSVKFDYTDQIRLE